MSFTCYRCNQEYDNGCACSDGITLVLGDCRKILPQLEAGSVGLIVTDPPYFKVKDEPWDRQWDKPEAFLAWLGSVLDDFRRVLAPNGSLYCFASPQMAWGVEGEIQKRFGILNRITWAKHDGTHNKGGLWSRACKDEMRAYFPQTEVVFFAEHFNADNTAKGESSYVAKCDELRGFVFEPLRAYLAGERDDAGWTTRHVAERYQQKTGSRTVTGMAGHWFEQVQWTLPTEDNYKWLRELFNTNGDAHLRREYEDLRREYEDLRREYEDLRRPFNARADVPYTDVWDFPTVSSQRHPGKHPCEKPASMLEHIVEMSTRDDSIVLDAFAGSGSTLVAAKRLGRKAIGIELEEKYARLAANRLRQEVLF